MNWLYPIRRFGKALGSFLSARGGNIAPTFALATIPVVAFVGCAVDYSRGNSLKAAMQNALDSTALMVGKNATGQTQDQVQSAADQYFKALLTRPEAKDITIHATYTTDGGSQILLEASTTMDTEFMRVLGVDHLGITASSTAKWGNTRLRVALALDNTGSMSSHSKMSALKTATKNLLTQLKGVAVNPTDVYVSIVPFSKDVAVDPAANLTADWIDWTDWDAANGSCSKDDWQHHYRSKSACTNAGGTWTSNNRNTWTGCFTDRGNSGGPDTVNNYDTNVTIPNPLTASAKFPAEQYSSCPQAVKPLSNDWTTMNSIVDNMSPAGNTNQGIGLAWGWQSLVGGGAFPMPPTMDPLYKYTQVIILLTDGLNTQNRWYTSQASIDAREKMTCDNAKANGIVIYTVQVNTDGDPTSTLLQNCASGSDKFFLLTSSTQIVTTFAQIGTALSNLRVAK